MSTDMGEYIVGAYLKVIKKCDFVDYNVHSPVGGIEGLGEMDVIGLDFKNKTVYLCEVTTHILGTLYNDNPTTVTKIKEKYERQKEYASKYLTDFPTRHYMFWSPVVPEGYITNELDKIDGLEMVINLKYTQCIEELRAQAKVLTHNLENPFFRVLQILEHLKTK